METNKDKRELSLTEAMLDIAKSHYEELTRVPSLVDDPETKMEARRKPAQPNPHDD